MEKNKIGKALTWDDLANLYDKAHPSTNRPARTLPMDQVFNWVKRQTNKYYVVPKEGTIHLILS